MTSGKLSEAEVAAAHAEAAAGRIEFDRTLQALLAAVTSADQVEMLARVGFSLALGDSGKERDPRHGGVEVFHVEILQALALSQPRRLALPGDDYPEITQSSIDLIKSNAKAYRSLSKIKVTDEIAANQRQELIALVQSWTLAVRGSRHAHQTRDYIAATAAAIDTSFGHHLGCKASSVVEMPENIVRRLERRLIEHIDGLRAWMRKKSGIAINRRKSASRQGEAPSIA